MAELTSWCRGCDSLCGVLVQTASGRPAQLSADPEHPLSGGFVCDHGRSAPHQATRPDRVLQVGRSDGHGGFSAAGWDQAMQDLHGAVSAAIASEGPEGFGLLLGGSAVHSQRLHRSVARLRSTLGDFPVFTRQARVEGPMAQASRQVLGRACDLRADLARAHHLLLLGGNQLSEGWAPGHAGQVLLQRLGAAGRARPRLTVADPRCSGLAARADQHLKLRPGTELYLLLGMASAMIKSGWVDQHHLRLRSDGIEGLREALAPWTPARAAELCGLGVADISAEALRFSRAPTAAIMVSSQALGTPWSTLTAWAVLVVQALSNNLLEPGGLYAHPGGVVPANPLRARADSALPNALRRGLRVLLCVQAESQEALPGTEGPDLAVLDRLICIDRLEHPLVRRAQWLLPGTHFLEEPDLGWADRCGRRWLQWSSGSVVQPEACRPAYRVLDDLQARLGAGPALDHARLERQAVSAVAQASGQAAQAVLAGADPGLTRQAGMARGFDGGHVDRATWAVEHPSGRQQLASVPMLTALARHRPAGCESSYPLRLLSSARRDVARGPWERQDGCEVPGIGLHPDQGFADGQCVRVVSPHGACEGPVRLDPGLEPSTVDCPVGFGLGPLALVEPTHLDPWSDTAWTDGQPCRVEPSPAPSSAPKPRA
jgi:anaerobic selenocysteine-containing dehydrogenase